MKYVNVIKLKLSNENLSSELLYDNDLSPKDFFQTFAPPLEFTVDRPPFLNDDDYVQFPTKAISILGVWYLRGTAIHFPDGSTLQTAHPHPEYRYHFVDTLPNFYIKRGATTTAKAYALGQDLIAKAQKASRLYTEKTLTLEHPITKKKYQQTIRDYSRLESAYKKIARALLDSGMYNRFTKYYFESPNDKTWTEVFAERALEEDLKAICDVSENAKACRQKYTDEQISFYGRLFGIDMPEYFLRYRYSKKRHGYATIPVLTDKDYATMSFDSVNNRMYAGNLEDSGEANVIPYTLQIDGLPRKLENIDEVNLTKIAEAIDFYLNLPEQERASFIADGFGYCFNCHDFYEEAEGCSCGAHKPLEDTTLDELLHLQYNIPSRKRG